MAINNFTALLLITITMLSIFTGCKKDKDPKPCRQDRYNFLSESVFEQQQENYLVGDTIYLISSIPKVLVNTSSNQSIDYSNAVSISGNFNMAQMDSITKSYKEALNLFDVIKITGTTSPNINSPNLGVSVFYSERTSTYELKMALKLKTKGLFYIGLTNLGSNGLIGKDCTNAGFDMTVTNSNKHAYIFQNALGYYPDALLLKGIYCFRVQ